MSSPNNFPVVRLEETPATQSSQLSKVLRRGKKCLLPTRVPSPQVGAEDLSLCKLLLATSQMAGDRNPILSGLFQAYFQLEATLSFCMAWNQICHRVLPKYHK